MAVSPESLPSARTSVENRSTWVVLCTPTGGKPFPEYVEGTQLVTDSFAGVLRILDGERVVREYAKGAWSNFAEWVAAYTDYFSANVIRLASVAAPRSSESDGAVRAPTRMPGPRHA